MKALLLALSLFIQLPISLCQAQNRTNQTAPVNVTECDVTLLKAFGIDSFRAVTPTANTYCPAIKSNCCDNRAMRVIYQKWAKESERKYIVKTFSDFTKVFNDIFASFQAIEAMADTTKGTLDKERTNFCYLLADSISTVKASQQRATVMAAAQRTFKFLYESHKGFYCSVCDADLQKFINKRQGNIKVTHSFCSSMVENTLGFYLFKDIHLIKIARLYAQYLRSCSAQSEFRPNRYVPTEVMLFQNEGFVKQLRECKEFAKGNLGMKFCEPICLRFHPLKFDEGLEGGLDRLNSYSSYLQRILKRRSQPFVTTVFGKGELNLRNMGRLLQATKATAAANITAPSNISISANSTDNSLRMAISQANQDFELALLNPVTYIYSTDGLLNFSIDFERSIIAQPNSEEIDVSKFRMVAEKEGINFRLVGSGSQMNLGMYATVLGLAGGNSTNTTAAKLKLKKK